MKTLQYTGKSHFRLITPENWEDLGIDESRTVNVRGPLATLEQIHAYSQDSTEVVELTNEAADWLLTHEKGEWKEIVEEDPEEVAERAEAERLANQARPDVDLATGQAPGAGLTGEPSEVDPTQPKEKSSASSAPASSAKGSAKK